MISNIISPLSFDSSQHECTQGKEQKHHIDKDTDICDLA